MWGKTDCEPWRGKVARCAALATMVLSLAIASSAAVAGEDVPTSKPTPVWVAPTASWESAYSQRKAMIRKGLSPAEVERCQKDLKSILQDVEMKATCRSDSDCALLEQLPFGMMAVGRVVLTDLRDRIRNFHAQCDDGSTHMSEPEGFEGLVQRAVCYSGRCMVATQEAR